ncbi:MAG: response regulator [Deltaproteobacteria bacterium]|nr:response regulator [Deltaproteobacteria bacterium]
MKNKKILIVDDEKDILETLDELLPMCRLTKVASYKEASVLLESDYFDLAILDIMGVDGFSLLETAKERRIPAAMLTANALTPESTVKSFKGGAAYYIPKEKMNEIRTYLIDIFESIEKGKSFWVRWLDRFAGYYDEKFGNNWKEKDKDFWDNFPNYL